MTVSKFCCWVFVLVKGTFAINQCTSTDGILISEKSVFTHYEFDSKKAKPEGKIDITYLPYLPNLQIIRIGGYLRNKAEWYRKKIKEGKYKLEKKGSYYEFIYVC